MFDKFFFKNMHRNATLVDLWSSTAGVGLWDVVLSNGDPMDPKSHWTWSSEFRRLLGFSSKDEFPDVVGSWSDRLHPEDRSRTFTVFGAALEGKTERYDVTYRLRMRDNSYHWFRATGGVTRDRSGKATRACGSLVDIHEGYQREELLEILGTTAGIGLWDVVLSNGDPMDPKSQWTWSSEFRRLLGFSSKDEFPDVVGSWSNRLHPEDRSRTFAAFGAALEGKTEGYDITYRLRMRDNSYRWFRATGGVTRDRSGKATRACGSLVDIQDAKDAVANGYRQAAQQLEGVVETVTSASEELSAQVEQSSRGSEEQAHRLDETGTSMEEMNSTVIEISKNASNAASTAEETRIKAEKGAKLVTQLTQGIGRVQNQSQEMKNDMDNLGKQAQGIGQILNVISDIADQTNLLALNAAIEAARAGEAGRGFAVVADEVRKLAEKTMTATKEVAVAIRGIQDGTKKNIDNVEFSRDGISNVIELANISGESLLEIVSLAEATTDQISSIATASEEMASASEEITRSIVDVNRLSMENAEAMRQSAQAVGELANQASVMNTLIADMKADKE
jgi:methyl-accepting chemotaxis protein